MHILFQKIKKCITHLCMHTLQTQDIWLWRKCPPSAFSMAVMSVAEMSVAEMSERPCKYLMGYKKTVSAATFGYYRGALSNSSCKLTYAQ